VLSVIGVLMSSGQMNVLSSQDASYRFRLVISHTGMKERRKEPMKIYTPGVGIIIYI
jgi:hypothetical protein